MKLQPASRKEVMRIAFGTGICSMIMIVMLFLLSLAGIGTFDYRVAVGATGGCLVAVANFAILCITIQNAVSIAEQKQMKAFIQGSYNGRLLLQAAWMVIALTVSHINVFAAALPLLFPNLVIFYLQRRNAKAIN